MPRLRPAHRISEKRRTTDVLTDEQVDFKSLLLSDVVLNGLNAAGFEKPSPIQLKAIPLGRCGLDLIAQAKSGTGKTCVFSVIALEGVVLQCSSIQALILAPTREIAVQIKDVVTAIGCHMGGLTCCVFIGGVNVEEDKKAVKKCHIAVGTPGRVKFLIENKFLKTDSIRLFILDEADKLLDESFQEQINWIFSSLPINKQVIALSATYPEYLAHHLTRYMREPTFVRLNADNPTLQGLKQFYCVVPFHPLPHKTFQEKVDQLLKLLSRLKFHQCLIFSNYQIRAQSLCETLCSKGWPADYIAGSQTQSQRLKAMDKLKSFKCRILISTDLTARGIDAERVNLVVNMDVPRDSETYLHRIGRAGRFGTRGVAVTYIARGKEESEFAEIKKGIGAEIDPLPEHIPESFYENKTLESEDVSSVQMPSSVVELSILKQDKSIHGKTGGISTVKNDTSCSNNIELETFDSGTEEKAEDSASLNDLDKKQFKHKNGELKLSMELQSTDTGLNNGSSKSSSAECLVNGTFNEEVANRKNLPTTDHPTSLDRKARENLLLCSESADIQTTKTKILENNSELKAEFHVDSEAGYTFDGSGTNSLDQENELDGDAVGDYSRFIVQRELEAVHRSNERITTVIERKLKSQKDEEQLYVGVAPSETRATSISLNLEHLRNESKTSSCNEVTGFHRPLQSNLANDCLFFESDIANNSDPDGQGQTFIGECKDFVYNSNVKGEKQHPFNNPLDTSSTHHSKNMAVTVDCSGGQTKSQRPTENPEYSTDNCHAHHHSLSGVEESTDFSLPSPDEFNEAFEKYLQSPFLNIEDPQGSLECGFPSEEINKNETENRGSGVRSSVVSLEHNEGTFMFSCKGKGTPKVDDCDNTEELREPTSKPHRETKKLHVQRVHSTSPPSGASKEEDQKRRQRNGITPSAKLPHPLDVAIQHTDNGISLGARHTKNGMSPGARHTKNGMSPATWHTENRTSSSTRHTENGMSQGMQEQFSLNSQESVRDYCSQAQACMRHVHEGPRQFSRTSYGRSYTVPANHVNTGALTDWGHGGAADGPHQHSFKTLLESDGPHSASNARSFRHTIEPPFTGQYSGSNDICYYPHIDGSLSETTCKCECVENPRGLEDCCTSGSVTDFLHTDCHPRELSWDPYSPSSGTQHTATEHNPWTRAWENAYQRQCNYIAHFVYNNKNYKLHGQ